MTDPRPRSEVWRPFVAGQARPCGRCGTPMIFVPGRPKPDGTPTQIPLDLTTLRAIVDSLGWECRSHFETCPAAAEFSRGKR